ncbi:sce7725 family protein [bacterium]|nr:sce7725 family protein [bacterium]
MYYPYFRGKQFELIVIREQAALMAEHSITPIIEPVRESFVALTKALDALREAECPFILIANPQCGDLVGDTGPLRDEILGDLLEGWNFCCQGHLVTGETSSNEIEALESNFEIVFIHDGIPDSATRAEIAKKGSRHIFIEDSTSALYRRHFQNQDRILIRDAFIPRKNREYPETEHFSDLHLTYDEVSPQGFGDYLMIDKLYSDSGGPAHAVAIHLTFIDPEENDMFIHHYVSDDVHTPVNPGGKFLQALDRLHADVTPPTLILQTQAVEEFLGLQETGHFPGLGYVKKLSMQHHIELMAGFLGGQ